MIDANILGFSRFMHIETLRNDEGYKKFKCVDKLPSEKVCRVLLKALPIEALEELRNINKKTLDLKSSTEDVREVCINIDDTVITIFGNQKESGIGYNPKDYTWHDISSTLSVTEITVPLPKWQRARRFVIIREKIIPKDMNQLMFEECRYKYQAIVTNIDYLTPEEIFQDYSQRCDVENNIDEIKEGYAFSENSLVNHIQAN